MALPGDDTRTLAANRLVEVDLTVPVQRGSALSLVRYFHSFFQPAGELGSAWTLDLPRLLEQRRPVRRTGEKVEYRMTYQLTSPLNTYTARFTEQKVVPEVQGSLLVPETAGDILGIARVKEERLGMPTHVVLCRDGRRWHFDEAGYLVADIEAPLAVVYRRDQAHRIQRMEGWYGKDLRADIRLAYDADGHLISAQGSSAMVVHYTYDNGRLTGSESPLGTRAYTYHDGLVTSIVQNGTVVRRFVYTSRGQLQREQHADDPETTYQVSAGPQQTAVTASRADTPQAEETVQYDPALRPVRRALADGTQVQWQYDDRGAVETTIILPEGERYVVSRAAHGTHETLRVPAGGHYRAEYDGAGRITTLRQGEHLVLRQHWHSDGQLASTAFATFALHPEYRPDGVQTGLLLTAPEPGPRFSQWLHLVYDDQGRVARVTDATGTDLQVTYAQTGAPVGVTSSRGRVQLTRDAQGRVETMRTSWGEQRQNVYDPQRGTLTRIIVTQETQQAVLDVGPWGPSRVQHFDGGELRITYHEQGVQQGRIKALQMPHSVVVRYDYDAQHRLTDVTCGTTSRLTYTYDAQGRMVGLTHSPATS